MECYDHTKLVPSAQISILNVLKGGQSWCHELNALFFLASGDDSLVMSQVLPQEFLVAGSRLGVMGLGLHLDFVTKLDGLDLVS